MRTQETSLSTGHGIASIAFVTFPRPGCRAIWTLVHCFLQLYYCRRRWRWSRTLAEYLCREYRRKGYCKRDGNAGSFLLKKKREKKNGRRRYDYWWIKVIGAYKLRTAIWYVEDVKKATVGLGASVEKFDSKWKTRLTLRVQGWVDGKSEKLLWGQQVAYFSWIMFP